MRKTTKRINWRPRRARTFPHSCASLYSASLPGSIPLSRTHVNFTCARRHCMYRRSCVTLIWNSLNVCVYARPLIHCLYLNRPRWHPSSSRSRLNKEKYLQLKNAVSIPEKKRVLLEQAQVRMESLGNDDVSTVYAPKGWLRRRKTQNSQRDRLGWFYDYMYHS